MPWQARLAGGGGARHGPVAAACRQHRCRQAAGGELRLGLQSGQRGLGIRRRHALPGLRLARRAHAKLAARDDAGRLGAAASRTACWLVSARGGGRCRRRCRVPRQRGLQQRGQCCPAAAGGGHKRALRDQGDAPDGCRTVGRCGVPRRCQLAAVQVLHDQPAVAQEAGDIRDAWWREQGQEVRRGMVEGARARGRSELQPDWEI